VVKDDDEQQWYVVPLGNSPYPRLPACNDCYHFLRFSADIGMTENGDVKAELILNELYKLAAEYF